MADRAAGRLIWGTFTPLFWALAALYLAHRCLVWLDVVRPFWLRNYLDDLLCLPLVLTGTLFCLRALYGPNVTLSGYQVGFVVVYVSVSFELFFPMFLPRYTPDLWDVAAYAAGGLFYDRFLNK
ncbi:hypothetical protein [Rufibacter psychrotolerans]|uniref:hypothetical protein n=1 Tax=Rufibacter psychrotolerans TaxID=2812556 RepID=UPI001967B862|nr:hypothetical protein [Rufibacter sp. SYSU D00308]